jgi:hypothetical protein
LPTERIADSDYGNEFFCSIGYENPDVLLLRWLRAKKWVVDDAVQQIMYMLKWRIEWGVQALLAKDESEISVQEIMASKGYFMGRDKKDRPICYIHVREHIRGQFPYQNTEKLAVLAVEMCRKFLKAPVETVTVVVDMTGFGVRNIDYQMAKFFITLLQSHFPESLGLGIVLNPPWLFNTCWAVIKSWLDPVVESKIRFIKNAADLTAHIDLSNLPKRPNGSHPDFQYIPRTAEDENMFAAFHADNQGSANAKVAYREAVQNYLSATLQWAHGDDSPSLLAEREVATEQLRNEFEKLVPYINTQTHYHRTGDIDEPIFDIAYEKLCMADEDIVCF